MQWTDSRWRYVFVQLLSVQSRDHRRCCVFCCVYLISTHLVQSVRLSLTHRYRRYHQLIMLCSCSIQSDYSFLFIHWFLQLLFLFFYTNVYGKTKWIEHFALYSIHKLWCPFTTVASVTLMISTKRCLDHDIEPNCIWNVYTCKGKIYHFINSTRNGRPVIDRTIRSRSVVGWKWWHNTNW